ncbi:MULTISPECIES: hypothetical protein [Gordonia]|uniref:hypothetical protein n=1 Tax=Gordonia oleivorans TaxID=3156618 RepID=UPI0032B595C0
MMILVLGAAVVVGIALVVALVIVVVVLIRSGRQQSESSAVLYPGHQPSAPPGWALGHDPEVRLYRRMQHAMGPLYAVSTGDAGFIDSRVRLELSVAQMGAQLVALSGADRRFTGPVLDGANVWVSHLEALIPGLLAGSPVSYAEVDGLVGELPKALGRG